MGFCISQQQNSELSKVPPSSSTTTPATAAITTISTTVAITIITATTTATTTHFGIEIQNGNNCGSASIFNPGQRHRPFEIEIRFGGRKLTNSLGKSKKGKVFATSETHVPREHCDDSCQVEGIPKDKTQQETVVSVNDANTCNFHVFIIVIGNIAIHYISKVSFYTGNANVTRAEIYTSRTGVAQKRYV